MNRWDNTAPTPRVAGQVHPRSWMEVGGGVVVLILAVVWAFTLVMAEAGSMASEANSVGCLAVEVPAWAEWSFEGARARVPSATSALGLWLLCMALAFAGRLAGVVPISQKTRRTLWLISAVALSLGAAAAGDAWILGSVLAAAWLVWGVEEALRLCAGSAQNGDSRAGLVRLKPAVLATVLGGLSFAGLRFAWGDASFVPRAPVSPGAMVLWASSGIIGVVAVSRLVCAARWSDGSFAIRGAFAAAVLAGAIYVGVGQVDLPAAWAGRADSLARWLELPARRAMRAELTDYRKTPREAAAIRVPNAEATTAWQKLTAVSKQAQSLGGAEGEALALWLAADAVRYAPDGVAGLGKVATRLDAFAQSNPWQAAWCQEASGWLNLAANGFDAAAPRFAESLRKEPANAMAWYGLARAEAARQGREAAAIEALATACLLEPRLLFSPALLRREWAAVREPASVRSAKLVEELEKSGALPLHEGARHRRFIAWLEGWRRADGRVAAFLADPACPAPVLGSVRCVRERLSETLASPDDARIGAIFGSGVALLTDRHFNLGQAHALFEKCQKGGAAWAASTGEHILRTRPVMVGWRSSFTEGGVGASLGELEENMLIRLTCYGWEDAPVQVDEAWLREQLAAVSGSR